MNNLRREDFDPMAEGYDPAFEPARFSGQANTPDPYAKPKPPVRGAEEEIAPEATDPYERLDGLSPDELQIERLESRVMELRDALHDILVCEHDRIQDDDGCTTVVINAHKKMRDIARKALYA